MILDCRKDMGYPACHWWIYYVSIEEEMEPECVLLIELTGKGLV